MRALGGSGICAALLLCAAPAGAQLPGLAQTPRDRELRLAESLRPSPITLCPGRKANAIRTVRLRVHAAEDYHLVNGKGHFQRLLSDVNRLAADWPGVRFEIAEYLPWNPRGERERLDGVIRALVDLDDGEGVDLVVGLVGGLTRFPQAVEQAGMARRVGRHLVLRGFEDVALRASMEEGLTTLFAVERDAVLEARRRHFEATLFLHEWGHALGLPHTDRATAIMNSNYHSTASELGEAECGVVEAAMIVGARGDEPHASAVRAAMAKSADPGWEPNLVTTPSRVPRAGQTQPVATNVQQPPDWSRVVAAYRKARAVSSVEQAAVNLDERPRAEALEWARRMRRAWALPADAAERGVPADWEGRYVYDLELLRAAIDQKREAIIPGLTDNARQKWPKMPGADLFACEWLHHAHHDRDAALACERALAMQEDLPLAHAILGEVALAGGKAKKAGAELRRAVELAPDDGPTWKLLAAAYRALHDRTAVAQVAHDYEARFNTPLGH